MNRRQFLKKSLEGIVISSIPFISCGKNPLNSEQYLGLTIQDERRWRKLKTKALAEEDSIQWISDARFTPAISKQTKPVIDYDIIQEEPYEILLKSRHFIPEPGISKDARLYIESMLPERAHIIMQFYYIPNKTEREVIQNVGVNILSYIPNKAWFASFNYSDLGKILNVPIVRSIVKIIPEDKVAQNIRESGVGKASRNSDGTVSINAIFFDDVSEDKTLSVINKYGEVEAGPIPILGNAWIMKLQEYKIYRKRI